MQIFQQHQHHECIINSTTTTETTNNMSGKNNSSATTATTTTLKKIFDRKYHCFHRKEFRRKGGDGSPYSFHLLLLHLKITI